MRILVFASMFLLAVTAKGQNAGMTIRQQIDWLQRTHQVHFIYDASLPLSKVYEGQSLLHLTTARALKALFRDTNISYELQGTYVLLKQRNSPAKTAQEGSPRTNLYDKRFCKGREWRNAD